MSMAHKAGSKCTSAMLNKIEPKGKAAILVLAIPLSILKVFLVKKKRLQLYSKEKSDKNVL